MDRGRHALGRAVGRLADRPDRGRQVRLPAPPRPRPPHPARPSSTSRANIDALKRGGLHRPRRHLRDRLAARGAGAGPLRRRRPVHRPHRRARSRASSAPASSPMSRWPIRSARASPRWPPTRPRRRAPRSTRGGCYVAIEGPQFSTRAESRALPRLGRRRDRHDRHARGEARPRGRAALRLDRHGHRLRLLARGRGGRRRRDRRPAPRQCRHRAPAGRRAGRGACRRSARPRRSTPISTTRSSPPRTRATRRWSRSSTRSAGGCWRDEPAAALCAVPRHPHRARRTAGELRFVMPFGDVGARPARLSARRRDRRPARIRRLRRALRGARRSHEA